MHPRPRADCQRGELIDRLAAGPPVRKLQLVQALWHVRMPFAGNWPDHRGRVDLATLETHRAAEAGARTDLPPAQGLQNGFLFVPSGYPGGCLFPGPNLYSGKSTIRGQQAIEAFKGIFKRQDGEDFAVRRPAKPIERGDEITMAELNRARSSCEVRVRYQSVLA